MLYACGRSVVLVHSVSHACAQNLRPSPHPSRVCPCDPSSHTVLPSPAQSDACRTNRTDGAQGSGSGGHRGGYEAYSSMAFAQGGVPQQHVTANDMPSPETDVQRNDLAPDASLSMSLEAGSNGGGMGSLTGWQALANEVNVASSAHTALPCCAAISLLQAGWYWSGGGTALLT